MSSGCMYCVIQNWGWWDQIPSCDWMQIGFDPTQTNGDSDSFVTPKVETSVRSIIRLSSDYQYWPLLCQTCQPAKSCHLQARSIVQECSATTSPPQMSALNCSNSESGRCIYCSITTHSCWRSLGRSWQSGGGLSWYRINLEISA